MLIVSGSLLSDGDGSSGGAGGGKASRDLLAHFTVLAKSDNLGHIATFLVLVNMILMCMPYYGMSDSYEARLEGCASVITWLFICEMSVKLLGLGCAGYWADGWNVLDGSIVTVSIVEMVATVLTAGSGVKLSFLRILRMLRVLRVLRLMRQWNGLYKIITTLIRAIPQMANLVFLILLTMFMFSVLGMQVTPLGSISPAPEHMTSSSIDAPGFGFMLKCHLLTISPPLVVLTHLPYSHHRSSSLLLFSTPSAPSLIGSFLSSRSSLAACTILPLATP